jgi:hypothetical protein
MTLLLPRYVIAKPLASGATGFYFTVPTRYRKMGCAIPTSRLGPTMRSRAASMGRAAAPSHSTDCSTNGGKLKTESWSKACRGMERSIGCFGNIKAANAIASAFPNARVKTMSC